MTQLQQIVDVSGRKMVQIPLEDWTAFQEKLTKYEQLFKFKNNLQIAFGEVKKMQEGKLPKKSLKDALNEI